MAVLHCYREEASVLIQPFTWRPCRPSHYVGGILSALKQFLDLPNARAMQPAARTEVAEACPSLSSAV